MTALILPRRFTQQPQGIASIDRDNPITRGIQFVFNGATPSDYVRSSALSVATGAPNFNIPGPGGASGSYHGSTSAAWRVGRTINSYLEQTVFIVASTDTSVAGNHKMLVSSVSNNFYISYYDNAPFIRWAGNNFGTGSPTLNKQLTFAHSYKYLSHSQIYIDGAPNGAAGANTDVFTASDLYIGCHTDGTLPWRGHIYLVSVWDRALTEGELRALHRNPWQIFKPRRQVLYFDVGGGNTPSAADAGAITLTGSAANGVRALAGVAASGSIALTGSAANAVRALAGVAASGSITLTGSNAAALRTWLGVAGAGSITLTGSDAAGVKAGSGAYTSAADAGSITLSGSAAVGTYDRLAAAGSGSITLTGSDASGIRNIPATAEAGSIVLTGSAAVGIRTWLAAAEAGSVTLTGSDAEGVFGGAMTLTQADLDAITAAVWADPRALTLQKFMALK